ncbi:MAG TPA: BMP family ABC transporter substrate-binding protein [Gaiellaceae bacterium]|nr:BMP family ABC transporter substrate-binding protein [Gaiellaceae bacterium]
MKVSRKVRVVAGIAGAFVASLGLVAIATGATADKNYGAIVTDTAGLNDRSFNFLANKGRLRAQAQLGMTTRAFISKATSDYLPNLAAAAQEAGDGVVIANGFLLGADLNTAAGQFPNTNFAIVDFPWVALADKPANAAGLTFKAQESGYLVGYLAALMAQAKGGKQVVSAVGGQKIPSVDSWIAGYRAGAQAVNKKFKVLIAYSGQFPPSAAPKCKEIALNQISRGSQAVFQVAGGCGLGALDAAKQKKVWGIGVDADQYYLGSHILTSGVKRVDTGVYAAFAASKAGRFQGGRDFVFNLKNKGMDVGKISPKVPKAFIARMNAQKALIIKGKIKPPATL